MMNQISALSLVSLLQCSLYIYSASFLSSRPNWLPLPPHPPHFFQGGTHSLAGEGAGGANSDEGTDTLVL
jgi:hypothetical protein